MPKMKLFFFFFFTAAAPSHQISECPKCIFDLLYTLSFCFVRHILYQTFWIFAEIQYEDDSLKRDLLLIKHLRSLKHVSFSR